MANYKTFLLAFASLLFNEIELNEAQCNPNPCQNAGVCIPRGDDFQCICEFPRFGKTCTDICAECLDPKCPANTNIGQCSIQCTNSRTCSGDRICCADGNCGTVCFSACDSSPCKNGGRCLTRAVDAFQCECTAGFTGTTCEEPVITDPCNPSPCKNNGICQTNGQDFTCQCRFGFKGRLCERRNSARSRCQYWWLPEVPCRPKLCDDSPCSLLPQLTCKIDRCGRCKARFYNRFGFEVPCTWRHQFGLF
ncbi:uncharacterized protein LOC144431476 [Styela clava]